MSKSVGRGIKGRELQRGGSTPPNWPPEVKYIDRPRYAPRFPPDVRVELEPSSTSSKAIVQPYALKCELSPAPTVIRRIEDHSHPAFQQRGLFAARTIAPKTFIIQYIGEIHVDDRPTSDYDLSLAKFSIPSKPSNIAANLSPIGTEPELVPPTTVISVGIDAAQMGNEARFVNDYRGTGAERPNAFFKDIRGEDGVLHMTIWTGKESIPKGKEILVSYGKGWWAARNDKQSSQS